MADVAEKTRKSPVKFLSNVKKEMKKVTWPTRQELFRYTLVTILTVLLMAVFLWAVDLGISKLLELFMK
ncbi:preprotein translocase subunit E [Fictibacillus macauensis ZFHKF-1]|uniref:Protein translocase subunit SecE n=1 Tax=Fictibacillus macauensis ZFHKF-1 TaxID=1196324 RepID=I8AEQ6_9BACL|nr:preprotein translocase subunit SecE [Fictibacillus macauensis]EIT84072.1 preprotein translocase subunit E [Fictibacillus macauensis ZFHKF-1]